LPINGKNYTIPPLGAADGLRFSGVLKSGAEETWSDDEFKRVFLGSAYDEMLADNVPETAVSRAAITALAEFKSGRAAAEIMWETNGDPKALTSYVSKNLNRASRRSSSTGGAKKIPSQGSTKATTSQKS